MVALRWYDELELISAKDIFINEYHSSSYYDKISDEAIDIIEHFEGWHNKAYLDPVGIPTIGVGFIEGVQMGDYMTDEQIILRLRKELTRFKKSVNSLVNMPITQYQFDALVSLSYNIGTGAFQNSTLRKRLNNGDYSGAANEFSKWRRAGGKTLLGLQRRRSAESLHFQGKDWKDYQRSF